MKRYVTALLALLLTTSFVGCVDDTPSDVSDSVAVEKTQEDGELLIWYDSCSKDIMMGLITEFQKEYPGIEVITEDYSDMIIPDYRTKLAGKLMAGGGPDIVLSKYDNNNIVQNLTKLLQNGIFLDVNTLGVDFSDCNQAVLASGVYEGGQYMVPLNYSLGFLLSSQERIDDYGLVCDGDLASFADSLTSVYDAGNLVFSDIFTIEFLYFQNGMSLMDYENQTLNASEEELKQLKQAAEAYDKLFPRVFTDSNALAEYQLFTRRLHEYDNVLANAYSSEDLVLYSAPGLVGTYDDIRMLKSVCNEIQNQGQTPYLTRLPTVDGGAPSPVPNWFLLVNGKTEHTREAACFIRSAIGIDSQYEVSGKAAITVNNRLIEYMRAYYCDGVRDAKYVFPEHNIPLDVCEYYFDQIDSMQPGVYTDVQTMGHLFGVFREYLTGSDFDVAYDHAKNNVSFYLSE